MQYGLLGSTGLVVSRLSFGAMTFTDGNRAIPGIFKTEAAEADALVGRALDAGINFFDTADVYAGGQSEELLGAALAGRRADVVVATKVGLRNGEALTRTGLSARHIAWSVDQSLRRLGTDWIDVYIAHAEDPFTPLEETLAALDAVVRSGKARYLGFSNWPAWRVAAALELQKANGWARFTHGQMHYSLICRDVEREVVPMMAQYGLGMTVWSPLSFGFLSGKYTRDMAADPAARLATFDTLPVDKELGFAVVERMRAIAAGHGASVPQVALAWLLGRPAVSSVLLGASKLAQLDDNLGAADLVLSADETAALDAMTAQAPLYPAWFREGWIDAAVAGALGPAAPRWR